MQLTASEAAHYKDVQITRGDVWDHEVVKNFGIVRETLRPGMNVNDAQARMQLETLRRGGNAIYSLYAGENYMQGDAVLIKPRK